MKDMNYQRITPDSVQQRAEAFATKAKEAGDLRWDFSAASISDLDHEVRSIVPTEANGSHAAITYACYLGETIARNLDWKWCMLDGDIMLIKNGVYANPLGNVWRRIHDGPSLMDFYRDCELMGQVTDGRSPLGLGSAPSRDYRDRVGKWLIRESIRRGSKQSNKGRQAAVDQLLNSFAEVVRTAELTNTPPHEIGKLIVKTMASE
jgi:hypothetical protein